MATERVEIVLEGKNKTGKAFKEVSDGLGRVSKQAKKSSDFMSTAFAVMAADAAHSIGSEVAQSIDTMVQKTISIDSALANVRKTTGLTGDELSALGDTLIDISKTDLPIDPAELFGIAQAAGQLGITGSRDIEEFTKGVGAMSLALDDLGNANTIAMEVANTLNIFDRGTDFAINYGNALNEVSNNTNATARATQNFMNNFGGMAKTLGVTEAEALALGATLISMGEDGNDAGTRMASAFTMMSNKMAESAELAGVAEEDFRKAFDTSPLTAMQMVVEGVTRQFASNSERIEALAGIYGQVGSKSVLKLSGEFGTLEDMITMANDALGSTDSIMGEVESRTQTLEAQIQSLRNYTTTATSDMAKGFAMFYTTLTDGEVMAGSIMRSFENLNDMLTPSFKKNTEALEDFNEATRRAASMLKIAGAEAQVAFAESFEESGDALEAFISSIQATDADIEILGEQYERIKEAAKAYHDEIASGGTGINEQRRLTEELNEANRILEENTRAVASAEKERADATERLNGLLDEQAQATAEALSVEEAMIKSRMDAQKAEERLNQLKAEGKQATDEYRLAEIDMIQAQDSAHASYAEYQQNLQNQSALLSLTMEDLLNLSVQELETTQAKLREVTKRKNLSAEEQAAVAAMVANIDNLKDPEIRVKVEKERAQQNVREFISSLDGIPRFVSSTIRTVRENVTKNVSTFAKRFFGMDSGGIVGAGGNVLPSFDSGLIPTGRVGRYGQRGYLAELHEGEMILNPKIPEQKEAMNRANGNGGGNTFNFNISGSGGDSMTIAREVEKALRQLVVNT